jgi:repressor LexA
MINAGILDGDYVIVRQQPEAQPNEIVVALIGEEATIKRFIKEDNQIRLQPEHPTMEPILITPDKPLAILGKVVAVFRKIG